MRPAPACAARPVRSPSCGHVRVQRGTCARRPGFAEVVERARRGWRVQRGGGGGGVCVCGGAGGWLVGGKWRLPRAGMGGGAAELRGAASADSAERTKEGAEGGTDHAMRAVDGEADGCSLRVEAERGQGHERDLHRAPPCTSQHTQAVWRSSVSAAHSIARVRHCVPHPLTLPQTQGRVTLPVPPSITRV